MKYSALFWLTFVCIFFMSCRGYINISSQEEFDKYRTRYNVDVLQVKTASKTISFSEKIPGKMTESGVSGTVQVLLEDFYPDSLMFENLKYTRRVDYVYKAGIKYDVFNHDTLKIVFDPSGTIHIPYDEVQNLHLKVYKPVKTMALIAGTAGVLIGLRAWLISNMTFDLGW